MTDDRATRSYTAVEFVAPIFMAILGVIMLGLAFTQPAWIEGRIGPGLFARWLSAAVIGMTLLWLMAVILEQRAADDRRAADRRVDDRRTVPTNARSILAGFGLLSGVALFALALPVAGLVASCALVALVVSWGAGERGLGAYLLSGLSGAAAALALGLTLLPPGIRLWPPGL